MTKKTSRRKNETAAWPDFSAIRRKNDEEDVDRERERQLFKHTIEAFEEIDRHTAIAEYLAIKPFSESSNPRDIVHKEDGQEAYVNVIARDLFGPSKRGRTGLPPKRAKAAKAIRIIFGGNDTELKDLLEARLSRPRATRGRAAYDRVVLRMLILFSKWASSIWDERGVKRWKNMPTPHDAAVEYFLQVQGALDDDRARKRIRRELRKYANRPR